MFTGMRQGELLGFNWDCVDFKTIQASLGHATAQFTLDVYSHVTQKMRQDSADRMQQFYDQLTK